MLPLIAIAGRPNVGKSTLFNRLTRSRDALVSDRPGVTRDRQYGIAEYRQRRFILADTGGLADFEATNQAMAERVAGQSLQAIREADAVIWVVDGRSGRTASDESLATVLRPISRNLLLAVNKCEGLEQAMALAEFHALGTDMPLAISAERGDGIEALMESVLARLPDETAPADEPTAGPRVAVIGRPNVGKSTLINRMLGEERMLTFDEPGTTRDAISIPFQRQGKDYVLIDTAGVRRRARVHDAVEKFSVIKALNAIESSDIVLAVIDAQEALTDQDVNLLGVTAQSGKPLILAINKWDGLEQEQKTGIKQQLDRKLPFIDYAIVHHISALHGSGVGKLFDSIDKINRCLDVSIKSSRLTGILADAVTAHPPPIIRGHRIKLRYAHLGGHNPLRVIIHGNQTEHVPDSYTRYLCGVYRKQLRLTGVPVLIQFKYSNDNPYAGKKNELSKHQLTKRRRLMRHVKR